MKKLGLIAIAIAGTAAYLAKKENIKTKEDLKTFADKKKESIKKGFKEKKKRIFSIVKV